MRVAFGKIADVLSTVLSTLGRYSVDDSGILGLGSREELEIKEKLAVMDGALAWNDVETAARIRSELNLSRISGNTGPL